MITVHCGTDQFITRGALNDWIRFWWVDPATTLLASWTLRVRTQVM